jgi:hypothetical protein
VFWDELEHLDRLDVMRQAIRRGAFFKVNALSLRLNGHFEYASAAPLVDPYALSPAQLQELTDFGLRNLPARDGTFDWRETTTLRSQAVNREL